MKKVISLILAVAMLMSVAVMASATASTDPTTEVKREGDTQVDLIGQVQNESVLLSVVMPTSIDFIIGTTEETSGDFATAITGGTKFTADGSSVFGYKFNRLYGGTATVTNNSAKDVKLELTAVNDTNGLLDLVKLGLMADTMTASDVLTNNSLNAFQSGTPFELAASIDGTDTTGSTTGGTLNLKVVGAGAQGMVNSNSYDVSIPSANYTVQTTLKVSVVSGS